jgi:ribonuclease E
VTSEAVAPVAEALEAPLAPAVETLVESPVAQAPVEVAPVAEGSDARTVISETVTPAEPVAQPDSAAYIQPEPVQTPAPVSEAVASAPAAVVEAPAAVPAPQAEVRAEAQPAAAVEAPAVPAPAALPQAPRANGLSAESLQPVLEKAGLVWVNTDADKLRAAQEAAAQTAKPARVPRERKVLPPADTTPMQQVETAKHSQ